jgi:hypothetical protein
LFSHFYEPFFVPPPLVDPPLEDGRPPPSCFWFPSAVFPRAPLPEESASCDFSFLVLFSGIILLRCFSFFSPNVVNDSGFARCPRAIGAAEKLGVRLDSVTDNFASAIYANGR